MKIRFETTIEDIVAFNRFHYENSPSWRRQRLLAAATLPILMAIPALFTSVCLFDAFRHNRFMLSVFLIGLVLLILFFSIAGFFFTRWRMSASLVTATRKFLAEGSNRSLLGWRDLALVIHRLIVKMELLEASYDLRAIEKIVGDDKYTYVYVSSIQAFSIPMRLYPEDEYRQFVAELSEAWENREAPRPTEEAEPASQPDERIVEGQV